MSLLQTYSGLVRLVAGVLRTGCCCGPPCDCEVSENLPAINSFSITRTSTEPCCFDFAVSATVGDCGGTLTYLWDFGDGSTSTSQNVNHCYEGNGPWTASVTVSAAGCSVMQSSGTDGVVCCDCEEAGNSPVINSVNYLIEDVDPECCLSFTASVTAGDCSDELTYLWDFGDGTSTSPTPTHCFATYGPHPITLTVTDARGCSDSITFDAKCDDCNCGEPLPPTCDVTFPTFEDGDCCAFISGATFTLNLDICQYYLEIPCEDVPGITIFISAGVTDNGDAFITLSFTGGCNMNWQLEGPPAGCFGTKSVPWVPNDAGPLCCTQDTIGDATLTV